MTQKTEAATAPAAENAEPKYIPTFKGRTFCEIVKDLQKDIPARFLEQKSQGGKTITYVPWHEAVKLFEYYAPGWSYEVKKIENYADRFYMTVAVTVHASDGSVTREATGNELIDKKSFGDPSSNAESMAIRRAFAKFGFGLHLYDGDEGGERRPPQRSQQQQQSRPPAQNPPAQSSDRAGAGKGQGMANPGQQNALATYAKRAGKSEIDICEKFSKGATEVFEGLTYDQAVDAIKWLENQPAAG